MCVFKYVFVNVIYWCKNITVIYTVLICSICIYIYTVYLYAVYIYILSISIYGACIYTLRTVYDIIKWLNKHNKVQNIMSTQWFLSRYAWEAPRVPKPRPLFRSTKQAAAAKVLRNGLVKPPTKSKKFFLHVQWGLQFHCYIMSGWWLSHPSEKYESQLGLWNSQYMEKQIFQTTN